MGNFWRKYWGKNQIIINALPYQASGSKILEQIADQMLKKKIPMVVDLTDEGDHAEPIRLVITLKSNRVVAEDVMTTGGTTRKTVETLTKTGADVLGFILVLVNRSGQESLDGRRIIALIDHPMPFWEAEECPLCAQGSEAIRPKGRESWQELTAQ